MILAIHSLDHLHILVTVLVFLIGLGSMIYTIPQVSKVRRTAYYLAVPLWLGFIYLYGEAVFVELPARHLSAEEVLLRVILFGVALEGIIVPHVDRLEAKNRPQEFRVDP